MLSLHNIKVHVGTKEIIANFSHEFSDRKIYAIMGPNGSGKSTLVQSIIGNPQYTLDKNSQIVLILLIFPKI